MIYLGIDVSKAKVDCAWLRDAKAGRFKTRTFENNAEGIKTLLSWALVQTKSEVGDLHFTMEATGVYHEILADALFQAGAQVSVVNPLHSKRYGESLGKRSKTDKKDSIVLARFGATQQPRLWQPEPANIRILKALIGRLEAIEKDTQREQNRLEKAQVNLTSPEVIDSIQTMLGYLDTQKKALVKRIDEHIDQDPDLKADAELLKSVPGIGPVMNRYLLALLRSRNFESAPQVAAFAGLVPIHHESGSSVRGQSRISKTGSATFRAKLYMAAVVSTQHNECIRAHYQRLLKNGKPKMVALIAAMRKLIHICFGVLKHQTPFHAPGN